jgi:uncharacterized protein YndB with AHSA1/START domain
MATEATCIRLDRTLPKPPADVWAALTQPALLAQWWVAGDVQPQIGHRFTLDMGPWGPQRCEVLAVEPEWLLGYSFGDGTLDTTITWRLVPEGDGTRLSLEHEGFDLGTPAGKAAFQGMGAGWTHVVQRLYELLAPRN